MDDLISRQAAIDALGRIGSLDTYEDREYATEIFMNLPSAQPQWIPCSERPPEEDAKVLVTDEDGDIYIAYYDYNEWLDDPKIEWWTGEFRIYPIAWMPLPEPWKGEQP